MLILYLDRILFYHSYISDMILVQFYPVVVYELFLQLLIVVVDRDYHCEFVKGETLLQIVHVSLQRMARMLWPIGGGQLLRCYIF